MCDKDIIGFLIKLSRFNNIKYCFDVGAGKGKYGKIVKDLFLGLYVIAFEIWKDDADLLIKNHNYDKVYNTDFYSWSIKNNFKADLIIFGDVLEHFSKSKAIDIIELCLYKCKWIIINSPIGYIENPINGNINETHISEISINDLVKYDIRGYAKEKNGILEKQCFLIKGYLE